MKDKIKYIYTLFSKEEFQKTIPKLNNIEDKASLEKEIGRNISMFYVKNKIESKIVMFENNNRIDSFQFFSDKYRGECNVLIFGIDINGDYIINKDLFIEVLS